MATIKVSVLGPSLMATAMASLTALHAAQPDAEHLTDPLYSSGSCVHCSNSESAATHTQDIEDSQAFIHIPALFGPEECEMLIASLATLSPNNASVDGIYAHSRHTQSKVRTSTVRWLEKEDELFTFVYERIGEAVNKANSESWHFGRVTAPEVIQIAEYSGSTHGHYDWHTDDDWEGSFTSASRIISVSVQLTPSVSYQGGELAIGNVNMSTELGSAVIFPSYALHKVFPVMSGVRYSVVAWYHGFTSRYIWNRGAVQSYGGLLPYLPNVAPLFSALAHTVRATGSKEEAHQYFEKAAELAPSDPVASFNFAESLSALDRKGEALANYHQFVRLFPDDPAVQTG
jgi:PKHD-type hydroxylase